MEVIGTWERMTNDGKCVGVEWVDGMHGIDVLNRLEVMARYGEVVWDRGRPPDLPDAVIKALRARAKEFLVRKRWTIPPSHLGIEKEE